MNHHHPRHKISTAGASRLKRKERESFYHAKLPPPVPVPTTASKLAEPVSSNRLLAGYMAYEFLTKGTLLGQKFDPARAEAVPLTAQSKRLKPKPVVAKGEAEPSCAKQPKSQSYSEVASLLKSEGGAHLPGIVNPTQLASWIQM